MEQHAIYFDTPEHTLRKAGLSLRIRKAGEVRTQTVKATTSASAGLFARSEWEQVVEDHTPVLDHSTPLLNQIGEDLDRLEPLFEIMIERRKWTVIEGGSEIEVALDNGFVLAACREVSWHSQIRSKVGKPTFAVWSGDPTRGSPFGHHARR